MRNEKYGIFRRLSMVAAVCAILMSCGGGGAQKDGAAPDGSTGGGTTVMANSATLSTSDVEIKTGSSSVATISVLAKDAGNAAIKGALVTFSASGGVISAARGTTDDNGVATVTLGSGGDLNNQAINVTATVTGLAAKGIAVNFTGTDLSISGPTAAIFGQPATYTLILKDGTGKAIANQAVQLTASNATLSANSGTTSPTGQLSVTLTPTIASGNAVLSAAALGASSSATIAVSTVNQQFTSPAPETALSTRACQPFTFSATSAASAMFSINRGGLYRDNACTVALAPNDPVTLSGAGVATVYALSLGPGGAQISGSTGGGASVLNVKFVASLSKTITAQADPSVVQPNKTSVIAATVTDSLGYPVEGATVFFSVPSGNASMSTSSSLTNASGIATAIMTAGANTTGLNGVTVTTTTANRDSGAPVNLTADTSLTIAAPATSIDMGYNGVISKNAQDTAYFIRYTASLSDSSGAPLANQAVVFSRLYTQYQKGRYNYDTANTIWVKQTNATCDAEDVDGDGKFSGSELDVNDNKILDPAGDARLTSTPDGTGGGATTTVQTDSSGLATVYVHYLKDHGSWVQIRLKASAIVSGNNATTTRTFTLPVPLEDVKQEAAPAFVVSPFGLANTCTVKD